MKRVRLDRLQEYPSASLETVCRSLGLGVITPEALAAAVPSDPADGHNDKNSNHLGRIKFFFDHPSDNDWAAVMLCNGFPYRKPDLDEPHFFDGRHRFVAAALRGDEHIKSEFRWDSGDVKVFLSRPVMAYLTGDSDVKPKGTWEEWEQSDEYVDYY